MSRNKPTIYVGADHAGFRLKRLLLPFIRKSGYKVVDLGAKQLTPGDDYPDYAYAVAKAVVTGRGRGVLVCGSSQGVAIAANKVRGARAAAVATIRDAELSREHNDANIVCLSGWSTHADHAKGIVKTFLDTDFGGDSRHERRLQKIEAIEKGRFRI